MRRPALKKIERRSQTEVWHRTHRFSAVIATGVHLFPFRTEKLSPPAPMVLGGQPPGRVGRRRIFQGPLVGPFFWSLKRPAGSPATLDRARAVVARAPRRADA